MRIRNIVTGEVFEAEWTTDHAASSYGQPVLVLKETGEAVDAVFFEILEGEKWGER
jgi:hypothetical protein